jgi:vacuolar protein-sorting-associated protein 4
MVMKYSKNDAMRGKIRLKMLEYIERAEYIKSTMAPKGVKQAAPDSSGESPMLGGGIVVTKCPNVKWDDIAGLGLAKELLKESVLLPIQHPQMFLDLDLKPWKGILLYGPPGTGKSYLAKAVATETQATFFNITAADMISKWLGDSEKMIQQLFAAARERAPSVIFIDEIDAMCSSRTNDGGNAGGSMARIMTQFLVSMESVGNDNVGVLVLGATNIPWALDDAIRRRLERRIYIPLPDASARAELFRLNLGSVLALEPKQLGKLVEATEYYSGADISIIVRDAKMSVLRKFQNATHFKRVNSQYTPCSPGDADAVEMSPMDVASGELLPNTLTVRDLLTSREAIKPSVNLTTLERYEEWTRNFGSQ